MPGTAPDQAVAEIRSNFATAVACSSRRFGRSLVIWPALCYLKEFRDARGCRRQGTRRSGVCFLVTGKGGVLVPS
jgi:hypothetical protein